MKSLFEQNGGTYTKINGILYPNLVSVTTNYEIGIWGQRHFDYIKEHKKSHYTTLLTQGKLNLHLHDIDVRATEMYDTLVKQLAEKQGITEQLKADDMLAWVGAMNNIANQAKEIVNDKIIYNMTY